MRASGPTEQEDSYIYSDSLHALQAVLRTACISILIQNDSKQKRSLAVANVAISLKARSQQIGSKRFHVGGYGIMPAGLRIDSAKVG